MEVSRKLRAMIGMGTASLSLNSISQRRHKAFPDSRRWRNRLSLMEVGKVPLQKCKWGRRCCWNSLWKYILLHEV